MSSTSIKSRIPIRVRPSATVLDGLSSRIFRVSDLARQNRCSLNRSELPLPISSTLSSLVKQVSPSVVCKKPETDSETVIRSLVRRSQLPVVRGNRTSFRRIQLAHGSPVMNSTSSCSSTKNRLQIPRFQGVSSPAAPENVRYHFADNLTSAKSLLELVAGKRQPSMEQMRFLCNDHRLINVPSLLMYRYSVLMSRLEGEEQPIELRSIRSGTLLRVIIWMYQKALSGNDAEDRAVAPSTVEAMRICAYRESNGNTKSENSFQLSENTNDYGENLLDSICQIHVEKVEHTCTITVSNADSVIYQIGNDYASISYEETENSRENNGNRNQNVRSLDENARNTCFQVSDKKKSFKNNEQSQENYKVDCATEMKCSGYKQGTNEKSENCPSTNDNIEKGENNGNIQLYENNGNSENSNDKKDACDEYTMNSVISEKNTEIIIANSKGIKISEELRNIAGESSCLSLSTDDITLRDNVMQNFSDVDESNENRKCTGQHVNSDQYVYTLNGMKHSSFLLGSWEEQLLGTELYQLMELILASHSLGIESLTLAAIHHFDELMAERTRSESCLMLRIKTRLAGELQTLENHRPLTREALPPRHQRNYQAQADRAEIRKQHFHPKRPTVRMGRQRGSIKRPAGGLGAAGGGAGGGGEMGGIGGMGGRPYAIEPRRRRHQYCFQSRT